MTQDLFADDAAHNPQAPQLRAWAPQNWFVQPDWQPVLDAFWRSSEGARLATFIKGRIDAGAVIYPPHPLWALALTPLAKVRVVILGQDPYHGAHQAQGLSFSVAPGVATPPSLRNIFKELQRDLKLPIPASGSLQAWAERGVLLLNTSLTVEDGQAASHAQKGWESLTDALLAEVAQVVPHCVYMLWGAHAQAKTQMIRDVSARYANEALVLTANHPSPLSASRGPQPFVGCGHFSQAQAWLSERNQALSWNL
ncbi:MAG: hypothetical protein RLY90_870 [Pseudomonadota bacterium]